MTNDTKWLTLGEAARELNVAQSTLRKWADAKSIPTFLTPGGHRRFRREDLEAFQRGGEDHDVVHGRGGGAPEVLIVDDNPAMREMVAEAFALGSWRSREAASAVDAIHQLNLRIPDLMLVDVVMPGQSGLELMQVVRKRFGPDELPIFIYSGITDPSTLQQATRQGAQGYAAKPFDPYGLVAQANAILEALHQ
jgi:excisionase family DNA binding protein